MMSITETLSYVATFSELENLFKDASEGLTLFGYRYIKVKDLKGVLHIDALAIKVMDILHQNEINFDGPHERTAAKRMALKVTELYANNDKRANRFSYYREQWKEITVLVNSNYYWFAFCPKHNWRSFKEGDFTNWYTEKNYIEDFNEPFPKNFFILRIGRGKCKIVDISERNASIKAEQELKMTVARAPIPVNNEHLEMATPELERILDSQTDRLNEAFAPQQTTSKINARPSTSNSNESSIRLPNQNEPLEIVLSHFSTLSTVDLIAEGAQEAISFFGYRYIKRDGYISTIPLDALAAKVMGMVKPRFDFNENDRAIYKKLAARINQLFKANDARRVNCITRLFCIIRDLWKYLTTPRSMNHRYQWFTQKENETFEYYTPEQYQRAFNAPIPANAIAKTRRVGFKTIIIYRPVQSAC